MSIFSSRTSKLTRLFELSGADDPQSWAKSEVEEGDVTWIDREIQL